MHLLPKLGTPARLRAAVAALGSLLLLVDHAQAVPDASCTPLVVRVDWDPHRAETVTGVVVRVRYPGPLDMPASGEPLSSKDRVALLGGTSGGLFDAVPRDSDGDGRNDVLSIGLITPGIRVGPFARLQFDCAAGVARPQASELTCVSDVADETGSVPSSCSVVFAAD